jgi:hypothetical protein
MKLRRVLALVAVGSLALPGTVFAGGPDPTSGCPDGAEVCVTSAPAEGRYFYIVGIEHGDKLIRIEGKIWWDGGQLGASVGCNSIGGAATFSDDRLVLAGPLASTRMACEGPVGEAEAALFAVLAGDTFEFDGKALVGSDGRILVSEVLPVEPGDTPTDPGEVVQPEPAVDYEACRGIVPSEDWDIIYGRPGSGGTDAGQGGGDTGNGSGETPAGPPIVVDPAPGVEPGVEPGVVPGVVPEPIEEPTPADEPISGGAPDLPVANTDAATVTKAVESARTPTLEECLELLASIRPGAPPVDLPAVGDPADVTADGRSVSGAAENDLAAAADAGFVLPIVALLALITVAGTGLLVRRNRSRSQT